MFGPSLMDTTVHCGTGNRWKMLASNVQSGKGGMRFHTSTEVLFDTISKDPNLEICLEFQEWNNWQKERERAEHTKRGP